MTAQSFCGYVSLTKLSFRIIFLLFSITYALHHRRDYGEQKEVVVVNASLPVLPIKTRNVLYTKVSQRLR